MTSQLTIQDRGDVVMVSFTQARILDEGTIRTIGTEFQKLTTEAAADRKLLLNFRGVDYMSSAMLGKIMQLYKQCKADNIQLKVCSICPQVLEIFTITRLNKVLAIEGDEASALAAFSGDGGKKKGWFGR
ncbi:MAG: STAS domain-containing protein [Pirellulales bacterium]